MSPSLLLLLIPALLLLSVSPASALSISTADETYSAAGKQALAARGPIANSYTDAINPVWFATIALFGAFLLVVCVLYVLHTRSVRKVDRLLKAQQQHIELDEFAARSNPTARPGAGGGFHAAAGGGGGGAAAANRFSHFYPQPHVR